MITSIVLLVNAAILNNAYTFLVHYHIVEAPPEIKAASPHKMRPIRELLFQRVEVSISIYKTQVEKSLESASLFADEFELEH